MVFFDGSELGARSRFRITQKKIDELLIERHVWPLRNDSIKEEFKQRMT